ncbi:hypothetical protein FEM48_Zijuj08G0151400 [Ziziphus jujuba var. spinosa]|uniref:Pentatricopeptide repeat-containing protein n=1 Tax=Ziziphus jujuba var. spinosa TaxID=714518 RepID=A0A978UZU4_ZIZJJ|nr:hypothetical protein FEM48_Zijuj08G0151400 [Ziziphus jujuba var. spinosa]
MTGLMKLYSTFKKCQERNIASWNATISGLLKYDLLEEAGRLFFCGDAKEKCYFLYCYVDGYANTGEIDKARSLLNCIRHKNAVSWTVMISEYVENGKFDEAKNLYEQMPEKNVVAMTAMITGYCKEGNMKDARILFDEIQWKDRVSYNSMITGWTIYEYCISALPHMPPLLITGYAQNGNGEEALNKSGGILDSEFAFVQIESRDIVSWNTIIAAFAQHGLYEKAFVSESMDLFDSMVNNYGISPKSQHYACLVDILTVMLSNIYASAKKWRDVTRVGIQMNEQAVKKQRACSWRNFDRDLKMQQQMGQLDDELKKMEDKLYVVEEERDRALAELRSMKKMADEEANKRKRDEQSAQKALEMQNSMKEMLSEAKEELKTKEKIINSLKLELQKSNEMELKLSEKDISLNSLKDQLAIAKSSESNALALLSEREKQIHELEAEVENGKKAEAKILDSLMNQTEQLEETRILLQESKTEIQSLLQKVENLENSQNSHDDSELQSAKEKLSNAEKAEKLAWEKTKTLIEEMNLMKNELRAAKEAEENSKKALDDLALALKEVATEANQVKEKLGLAQAELDHSRGEEDRLSLILKSTEEKFKVLLDEARKEAELYRNTAERLRSEAEETLLAWNGKETGLVDCIKRAEEERYEAQQESIRLHEMLNEAEKKSIAAKEENNKLRDILKQALNEANVAKNASGIAKEENSQLKDIIAEKDRNLNFLTQENENFRMNEAAALENIKELKRLLFEATMMENDNNNNNKKEKEKPPLKDSRKEEKEKTHSKEMKKEDQKEGGHGNKLKASNLVDKEEKEPGEYKLGKTVSLNISEALMKGSIFGNADTPKSEIIDHHIQRSKTTVLNGDEGETDHSDHDSDHDHNLDENHSDHEHDHDHDHDAENERSNRKKKALIWRFGDLLKKRSTHGHRKEPPFE